MLDLMRSIPFETEGVHPSKLSKVCLLIDSFLVCFALSQGLEVDAFDL